ncbi:MAG: hypothetical protein J6T74_06305 [Clostridia bacterium]|nr:hypothetical protein [Clostridia bacterium]
MFFSKKKPQPIVPQYLKNDKGQLVGVRIGEKDYRIAAYELMMGTPGQKSIYLFDKLGQKVAWDIKSFEELDTMLKSWQG